MNLGTVWFKRFCRELEQLDRHLVLVPVKYGYYRIYWLNSGDPAYVHEVYKEMPYSGYEREIDNLKMEKQKYYEEFEDHADMLAKVKNFVEGYTDSIKTIKTRLYLLKNNDEFYKEATRGFKRLNIK